MLRFMFPEETLDWYTWRIASMVAASARLLLPLGSRCGHGSAVKSERCVFGSWGCIEGLSNYPDGQVLVSTYHL